MHNIKTGYGKSYASFGEIIQGRLRNGDDFLVTLPVNLWSTCELFCRNTNGRSSIIIKSEYIKSKNVAERMLEELELENGKEIEIKFTRNIPIGKGLSSSTADMLSVIRAFQEMFGIIITEGYISRLFHDIEPHDALHYFSCTVYNHRKGALINKLDYIPQYKIIGIDKGGVIDTKEYNNNIHFKNEDIDIYEDIYKELLAGFAEQDDFKIANCATRSAIQHAQRLKNPFLEGVLNNISSFKSIGLIAAHSGTCVGLIYPIETDEATLKIAEESASVFGDVFRVSTLRILT